MPIPIPILDALKEGRARGPFERGQQRRARFAIFLELRDGRIARQRNYDCFDPW